MFNCQPFREVREEQAPSLLALPAVARAAAPPPVSSAPVTAARGERERQEQQAAGGSQASERICERRVQAACAKRPSNPGNLGSSVSGWEKSGCPSLKGRTEMLLPYCSRLCCFRAQTVKQPLNPLDKRYEKVKPNPGRPTDSFRHPRTVPWSWKAADN